MCQDENENEPESFPLFWTQTSIVDDPCINRGVDTKIGSFCLQIQRTLFDKFSNPPFLFSEKNTGCVIDPQFLANVGTFCVDAVLGHSVSTIKLNGQNVLKSWGK